MTGREQLLGLGAQVWLVYNWIGLHDEWYQSVRSGHASLLCQVQDAASA